MDVKTASGEGAPQPLLATVQSDVKHPESTSQHPEAIERSRGVVNVSSSPPGGLSLVSPRRPLVCDITDKQAGKPAVKKADIASDVKETDTASGDRKQGTGKPVEGDAKGDSSKGDSKGNSKGDAKGDSSKRDSKGDSEAKRGEI